MSLNAELNKQDLSTSELNPSSLYLIHRAYVTQRKNTLQSTHSTKTRSEVRGGGRKPWKQKGSGRARAGSNRSPLWRGGGVIFGPKPRIITRKINKKEKQLALLTLLKLKQNNTIILDNFSSIQVEKKTQSLINQLKANSIDPTNKIGFIVMEKDQNLYLASRNLKNIFLFPFNSLNVVDLLKVDYIITTSEILNLTYQFYSKND